MTRISRILKCTNVMITVIETIAHETYRICGPDGVRMTRSGGLSGWRFKVPKINMEINVVKLNNLLMAKCG